MTLHAVQQTVRVQIRRLVHLHSSSFDAQLIMLWIKYTTVHLNAMVQWKANIKTFNLWNNLNSKFYKPGRLLGFLTPSCYDLIRNTLFVQMPVLLCWPPLMVDPEFLNVVIAWTCIFAKCCELEKCLKSYHIKCLTCEKRGQNRTKENKKGLKRIKEEKSYKKGQNMT